MTQTIDRRKLRTRRMLRQALLDGILEDGYDQLTIAGLTERADLRRATFYLHYASVEELLLDSLSHTMDELAQQAEHALVNDGLAGKTRPEAFAVTFQYVAENRELYQRIFDSQAAAVVSLRIRDYIASLIQRSLATLPDLPIPAEIIANTVAGAEVAMLIWWLENDCPYPPETMADMLHALILQGVGHMLPEGTAHDYD